MKCRTCLQELDLNSRLSLTTNLPIGKTVEEIILLFVPGLVKSRLVDNFICPQCMEKVQTFVKFIEKCISVENYLKQQEYVLKEINNVDSVNTISVTTSPLTTICIKENDKSSNATDNWKVNNTRKALNLIVQDEPHFNVIKNIINVNKTYSRGKRNSLSENEDHVADIPVEDSGGYKTLEISENEIAINFDENSSGDILSNSSAVDQETSHVIENSTEILKNGTELQNIEDRTLPTSFFESTPELKTLNPAFRFSPDSDTVYKNHRAVSFRAEAETISQFLKNFSPEKIKVMNQVTSQKSGPKRLVLLGTVLVSCPNCGEHFPTEPALRWHFREAHPRRKFQINCKKGTGWKCPLCKEQINTKKLLNRHMRRNHKEYLTYRCEYCNVVFKTKATYNAHVENYKLYKDCSIRKCFVCKEMISKHLYKKHTDSHRKIECPTCKKKFSTDGHLKLHLRRHKNQNSDCGTKPKIPQRCLCPICGVLMNDRSAWRIHITRHSETRSHLCSQCPKSFKTRVCLNKHMKNVHEKDVVYECSVCQTKVKSTWGLRNHMRLKHSTAYTHVCHLCGKGFVRGDYLKRHIRMHNDPNRRRKFLYPNDSLLGCKYCNISYKTIGQLRDHLRRVHIKNFVRYRCQYCSMTFSFLSNKIRHEKRHKDPRFELTCTVCWNKFINKEMLDEHYTRHSGSARYKCDICGEMLPTKFLLSNHLTAVHFDEELANQEKTDLITDVFTDFVTFD